MIKFKKGFDKLICLLELDWMLNLLFEKSLYRDEVRKQNYYYHKNLKDDRNETI